MHQLYEAKLEITQQDRILSVNSLFRNNSSKAASFTYRMKSERSGAAGKSVSSQSGSVQAAAGQSVTLSISSFSVSPQDNYSILLEILDQNKVISQDQLVYEGR